MRRVYLDSNATAPLRPEARAALARHLDDGPGNAASIHAAGRRARMAIEHAREEVAALVGARPREVVFTASGTEANNLALYGMAMAAASGRRRVVASAFEHPSVESVLADLARRDFDVVRVSPGREGVVPVRSILDAARAGDTAFVTLMLANNEIGTIQPVGELGGALRVRGIPLHTDAVQAVGKIEVNCAGLGVGLLSLSAHKLGGPQGVGALVVREGADPIPLLRGGGQEAGRRPGTENVSAIAAFGAAASAALSGLGEEAGRMAALRDRLEEGSRRLDRRARVNGAGSPRVPNTTSLFLPGATAESVVMALDLEGVCVSAGTACSSGTLRRSPALLAMGLAEESAASIRVSLSHATTTDEIDAFLEALRIVVGRVRQPALSLDGGSV